MSIKKTIKALKVYILDLDQPTTCPVCGARTEILIDCSGIQHHKCLGCSYEFVGLMPDDE